MTTIFDASPPAQERGQRERAGQDDGRHEWFRLGLPVWSWLGSAWTRPSARCLLPPLPTHHGATCRGGLDAPPPPPSPHKHSRKLLPSTETAWSGRTVNWLPPSLPSSLPLSSHVALLRSASTDAEMSCAHREPLHLPSSTHTIVSLSAQPYHSLPWVASHREANGVGRRGGSGDPRSSSTPLLAAEKTRHVTYPEPGGCVLLGKGNGVKNKNHHSSNDAGQVFPKWTTCTRQIASPFFRRVLEPP